MPSKSIVGANKFGFIITKPLQLLVVMALIEQLPKDTKKTLLIVDAFADAKKIAEIIGKYSAIWGKAIFFRSHASVSHHCLETGYANLLMDSDVGLKKLFELRRIRKHHPLCRFSVYEEGLGTYRTDLYKGWRKYLLRAFGAGVNFGGSSLVADVYVFQKQEYIRNFGGSKVITISCTLVELLQKYSVELFDIFCAGQVRNALACASTSRSAAIYLSSWEMDAGALGLLSAEQGLRILKPHPRRSLEPHAPMDTGLFIAPPGMPAEILLLIIGDLFDRVKIFHHGSSAVRYIQKSTFEYILLNQVTMTRFN